MISRWLGFLSGKRSRLVPERLWLLLGISWIVAITLAPFELSILTNELPSRLHEAFRLDSSFDFAKSAAHLISFLAAGFLVGRTLSQPVSPRRFRTVLVIGLLGCLALETGQLFQPGRHARAVDLALNMTGFAGGLWLSCRSAAALRWAENLRAAQARRRYLPIAAGACPVLVWCVICLQPAFGALRMKWDRTFPLMVANEIGGARPWAGQIRYAGVYDRALSGADVQRLHDDDSLELRVGDGLLAGYDFRHPATGELPPQGKAQDPDLVLTLPPNASMSSSTGLTTSRSFVVKSRGSAANLTDAIVSSGAFSVEAWVQPENLLQGGPARLISLSLGTAKRNFTVGQSGADLIFRVRNTLNSPNGTVHELRTRGVIDTSMQHFVATYDHGVSTIFKNGTRCSYSDLRDPAFYTGFDTGPLARAALLYLAVVTISLPAVFVLQHILSPAAARATAVIMTITAGVVPYVISCWVVGGPWRLSFATWFVVAVLLVFPIGLALISTSRTIPE